MTRSCLSACLLAATLAGCGETQPVLVPIAPHGGTLVRFPDGKGFVEVIRQDAPASAGQSLVVAYYLDPEQKPLTPAPTSATLKLRGARKGTLELKPTGDADPARIGGLATPPFDAPGGIEGTLTATLAGKPVAVPISFR